MWNKIRSWDRMVTAILGVAALSFAFWILVYWLGFDEAPGNRPPNYETYFQQANWWPFPFFFLALAVVLWLTWEPLLHAWRRLADTGVLLGPDGKPDDTTVERVLQALRAKRRAALLAALAVALFVNLADWAPRLGVFTGASAFDEQVAYACGYPAANVKWIFAELEGDAATACALASARMYARKDSKGKAPPARQMLFNAVTFAQQFLIVFFAALAVLQLLLHTLLFALFERLAVARAQGLTLMLNCRSPLNEFGLEHWNHALNNFYWAASPALLGVFLSRASTAPEDYLPGQSMLRLAVPACLLAPMIATIIARQARLPAAWKTLQPEGPVAPEDYRRQLLWPLDRNWSSKLGIILAFALAALSIGVELSQLVRF